MGSTAGCTPKAIQHRIAKMRGVAGGRIMAAQDHANADKASKTRTGRKKAGVVKACTPSPGDNDDEAAVALTPPPTIDRSRGKKRKAKHGHEEGGSSKKIKTEGAQNEEILGTEDIGEGLRQVNNGSDDE